MTRSVEQLRAVVKDAKARADRAEGALGATKQQLLDDYGCKTPKAAEAKLKKMKKELAVLEAQLETQMKEFENEHAQTLAELAEASGDS